MAATATYALRRGPPAHETGHQAALQWLFPRRKPSFLRASLFWLSHRVPATGAHLNTGKFVDTGSSRPFFILAFVLTCARIFRCANDRQRTSSSSSTAKPFFQLRPSFRSLETLQLAPEKKNKKGEKGGGRINAADSLLVYSLTNSGTQIRNKRFWTGAKTCRGRI